MSGPIRRMLGGSLAVCVLALFANANADPVERVVTIDVHNTRAQLAALDDWFATDIMRGQKATMWAPLFPGSNPANRTLVIEYDSFEDLVASTRRAGESQEWLEFQEAVEGTSEVISNSMAQQLLVEGSGWSDHGALLVVTMSVSDVPTYVAAFREMIEGVENPGSIRLMQLRYGGGSTNTVALFSAPDSEAANQYVDDLQGNEAFEEFAAKVAAIRQVNNISMMRRVKTWGD